MMYGTGKQENERESKKEPQLVLINDIIGNKWLVGVFYQKLWGKNHHIGNVMSMYSLFPPKPRLPTVLL